LKAFRPSARAPIKIFMLSVTSATSLIKSYSEMSLEASAPISAILILILTKENQKSDIKDDKKK
jgi:hypothetical protein